MRGAAAVTSDAVFVGDLEGTIHAINRANGELKWKALDDSKVWGHVSTDGNRVYSAHSNGALYALDVADGSLEWLLETEGDIVSGTVVSDGLVYFVSSDPFVYAVGADTGDVVWSTELLGGSYATPRLQDGSLLIGSFDDRVYSLDAKTGRLEWNFWTGGTVRTPVATSEDAVFFGSDDGHVYAVSAEDGSLNWRYETGQVDFSGAAFAEGLLYIGADSELLALDSTTGELVWQFNAGDSVKSTIMVIDDTVYFGSNDESVYAVAAGFPEGYTRSETDITPSPSFEPLSPAELKERLTQALGIKQQVYSTVYSTGPQGTTTVEMRDHSGLLIEIFENGYYLLTGRSVQQDGWEPRYLTTEDFWAITSPSSRFVDGWCCIRTERGLELIMRGHRPVARALAVTAHEAGHALHRLLNPAQTKSPPESVGGALWEAQAYSFEVAFMRKIGEYTGIETARYPSGHNWTGYREVWRDLFVRARDDPSEPHARGRLFMWLALLNDPELIHLKHELERDGQLSGSSLYEMYLRFAMLTPSEVEPYIESITPDTGEEWSDVLNYIFATVASRTSHSLEFPDLTLNTPTLVICP